MRLAMGELFSGQKSEVTFDIPPPSGVAQIAQHTWKRLGEDVLVIGGQQVDTTIYQLGSAGAYFAREPQSFRREWKLWYPTSGIVVKGKMTPIWGPWNGAPPHWEVTSITTPRRSGKQLTT